jgi:hypothetical protein
MSRDIKPMDDGRRGLVKSPQDFGAGLFLIALAAVGYFAGFGLSAGTLNAIGPGLVPKAVAVMLAGFGVFLIVQALVVKGELLERWSIRQPFFVLGSVILFALTIRHFGLVVAGPLAMIFSSFAEPGTKLSHIVIYSLAMTVFCILLFKIVLGLPIPILPEGIHVKWLG